MWEVCFFSGSAAVAAGHLVSADPVERVGRWKYSSIERSNMKYSTVEQNKVEGGWAAKVVVKLQSPVFGGLLV